MRTIKTIWYRELLNYIRDRARIVSSLVMSFTMLFVFTFALGEFDTSVLGVEPIQYLLPGIIATTTFMTSLSNALSVVEDKSGGFMKEFLVSPASRTSIALGKILGSATSAFIQGIIILIASPLFGMKYDFYMLLGLLGGMVTISLSISAIGLFIASSVKSTMGFQMIVQMLMMPMMFLSGAYVPVSLLPNWLHFIVYINPVTYAVSAFRHIALDTSNVPEPVLEQMGLILRIGDLQIKPLLSICIIIAFGTIFLLLAVRAFKNVSITQKLTLRRGLH